jgi:hypothetical protein
VHFVPPHSFTRISIFNFAHLHFLPRLSEELGYLLWFIVINLIGCGASQAQMFQRFFFQWSTLIGPSPKTFWTPPSSPKIDLHNFTHLMFYIYISVNGPCTLTWNVSLKPYTWYEHHKHIDNIYYYLYIIWIQIQLKSNTTYEKQDANLVHYEEPHVKLPFHIHVCRLMKSSSWGPYYWTFYLFHQFSLSLELYIPRMLKTPQLKESMFHYKILKIY